MILRARMWLKLSGLCSCCCGVLLWVTERTRIAGEACNNAALACNERARKLLR